MILNPKQIQLTKIQNKKVLIFGFRILLLSRIEDLLRQVSISKYNNAKLVLGRIKIMGREIAVRWGRLSFWTWVGQLVLSVLVITNSCSLKQGTPKEIPVTQTTASEQYHEKRVSISEFTLGPGDELEISVWRQDDLHRIAKITQDGVLNYPLVGDLEVTGMGVSKLREFLQEKLSKYVRNPQVSITIKNTYGQKVYILGEVRNPGIFQKDGPLSALRAVAEAGGFTTDAKRRNIVLIRQNPGNPGPLGWILNLEAALEGKDIQQNVYLQSGDIIYVPASVVANVDRFFDHLARMVSPITTLESAFILGEQVRDLFKFGSGRGGGLPQVIAR